MAQTVQEEAKLNAMQRAWQSKRAFSSSLFEDIAQVEEELLSPAPVVAAKSTKGQFSTSSSSLAFTKDEDDKENEILNQLNIQELCVEPKERIVTTPYIILNGSDIGDIPATYKICALQPHQAPVIGVYIDKRIVPGFKYKIRPLPEVGKDSTINKCLFNNRALTLKSIGRGFARRFTFEADENKLNNNDNYFYSDNRPEGYAFELELISDGDKFTIFDTNHEAQGTVEVIKTEGPQIEISNILTKKGIEKRVNVKFTAKVEFYETGVAKHRPLNGCAIGIKYNNKSIAEIKKILNVVIQRQRYYLLPGIKKIHRRVTVKGQEINDVPTKYTMTGLEPYEIPVVGTYVDPRIIPGFHYKVRPNDRKEHLFGGRALKLESIGMGYAKRLTFQPDSLLEPNNYLWSDNHPDGLGLEIRVVRKGMRFNIKARDQIVGSATVFRDDKPQMEEKMEMVKLPSGKRAIEKYVHIDVMCHIKLEIQEDGTKEESLMRVYGLAVVRKEPNSNEAHIIRVENVGLDSQLNVLFAQNHYELIFTPLK